MPRSRAGRARSAARVGIALVYHRVGGEGGDSTAGDPRRRVRRVVPAAAAPPRLATTAWSRRAELLDAVHDARAAASGSPWRSPSTTTSRATCATRSRPSSEAGVTATFFLGGTSLDGPHRSGGRTCNAPSTAGSSSRRCRTSTRDDLRAALERVAEGDLPRRRHDRAARPAAARRDRCGVARCCGGHPPTTRACDADDIRTLVAGRRRDRLPHAAPRAPAGARRTTSWLTALREGRDELAAVTGTRLETISYPHGKADERVARGRAQRRLRVRLRHGAQRASTPSTDPLLLPRIPPALSPGKTALRAGAGRGILGDAMSDLDRLTREVRDLSARLTAIESSRWWRLHPRVALRRPAPETTDGVRRGHEPHAVFPLDFDETDNELCRRVGAVHDDDAAARVRARACRRVRRRARRPRRDRRVRRLARRQHDGGRR